MRGIFLRCKNQAVMKPYSKYKPSGVEWLGEIPKHWEIKKLKYLISNKLEYGANESAEYDDREQPRYIRITDFGDNGLLKNDTFKSLPLEIAKDYFLSEGDILFARSGATVGKTFQFNRRFQPGLQERTIRDLQIARCKIIKAELHVVASDILSELPFGNASPVTTA